MLFYEYFCYDISNPLINACTYILICMIYTRVYMLVRVCIHVYVCLCILANLVLIMFPEK